MSSSVGFLHGVKPRGIRLVPPLKSVATYRSAEAAREEYDRLREEVLAMEDHLEEYLEEHPTGEGTIP